MLTLAGIDIGTNTIRLLIAQFSASGDYYPIKSVRHITRLGENISRTGQLSSDAIRRTLEVLKDFASICNENSIDAIYAVATSAVREASNGKEFIRLARSEAGLDVDVITGDEEARLTMLGVADSLKIDDNDMLLMDIGGGSTEFIFASCGRILHQASTDIGVVRFTEEYIHSDPPGMAEIESLGSAIEKRLDLLEDFKELRCSDSASFIGTAGTVTTLAAIDQGMTEYDPARISGYRMTLEKVKGIRNMLLEMTLKERKDIPGIESGREDLIAAGVIIVCKVMERFRFDEMIVSDNGLREGVVMDLYQRISKGQLKKSAKLSF